MRKTVSVFRKSLIEQIRSPWEVLFVLLIGPVFVLLYWLFFGGGSTSYVLLVLNQDQGSAGADLVRSIEGLSYPGGQPILKIIQVPARAEGEGKLRNRDAAALLVIPEDFTSDLDAFHARGQLGQSPIVFSGDLTNPAYAVAAGLTNSIIEEYLRQVSDQPRPVPIVEEALGGSAARTEFENYIPGLLVISIVMMLFTSAMRVTREVETGGIRRLELAQVNSFEYLAGVSGVQVLIGVLSVLITSLTALALGFHSQGPILAALLVAVLTSFSVIGVGLMVAAFSRTTLDAFLIANFPMFLLMFFSGGVFPLPRFVLFSIAGRAFGLFDILPQTHAVLALNKVITLGASLNEVAFELLAIFVLSALYFFVGVWLFHKRILKTG
jgi:ABC-2 type transport system permease protein